MRTTIRQRQFRGLVLHHRRHPPNTLKRYSTRSARYVVTLSDELDHRLAINVAYALVPAAKLRAFTPDNYSGRIANGSRRFCCCAAWSLLLDRGAGTDSGL